MDEQVNFTQKNMHMWGVGVPSILKEYIIIMSDDQIRKINTKHALESSAFRFILFFKLDLFNTQANADAVQVPTPSPFALTAELAYTSIEILKSKYNV